MKLIYPIFFVSLTFSSFSSAIECSEDDQSPACRYQSKQKEFLTTLQQTSLGAFDQVIEAPMKAKDAGCLSQINSIDLSVFVVDPMSLLDSVFNKVVSDLSDMACKVIDKKIQEKTSFLTKQYEAPFGLGAVTLSSVKTDNDKSPGFNYNFATKNDEAAKLLRNKVMKGVVSGPLKAFEPLEESGSYQNWNPSAYETPPATVKDGALDANASSTKGSTYITDTVKNNTKPLREGIENRILNIKSYFSDTQKENK